MSWTDQSLSWFPSVSVSVSACLSLYMHTWQGGMDTGSLVSNASKTKFCCPPQDFLSSLIPLLQLAARGCWTGWLSLGDSDQYMRCGSPMDPICNPKSLLPSYGPLDKLINWPNNNVGIPCNLSFGQYSFSSPCILKGIKMAQMVKPCRTKHSQSHEFHRVGCTEGQMDPSAVCKS